MRLLLPLVLLLVVGSLPRPKPGPCMPYAERCLHCSDCSQCKHCARDGGLCSVCWGKR